MQIYFKPCHFCWIILSYCRIYCDVVCINAKATVSSFVNMCICEIRRCKIIKLNTFYKYRN